MTPCRRLRPSQPFATRAAIALALPLLLLLSCASGAPGGDGEDGAAKKKKRTVLVTEYDDLDLGNEAAREIEAELGLYESKELLEYVTQVGRRLVQHAPLRPFQYSFKILDQMAPNAFSIPGGHIYVSRGLLALANSEDELANVLGHEIIHAADRHVAAQQELARRTNPFTLPFLRMARLAAYSRDHERAADRGGQILAAKAGYDPAGMSEFLKHLGDSERFILGYSRLISYFDTHPGTTERVSSTAARAMTIEWSSDPTWVVEPGTYLRRIDGIVLETDPAEGLFRGNEFVHPDLDFRILFPRGWELVNTHQAVGAMSPDGRARFFLTLEAPKKPEKADGADAASDPSGEDEADGPPPEMPTPREAAERFVAEHGNDYRVRVRSEQPVQLGDIVAYRLEIEGRMGVTAIAGHVTFIPHGGFVFRLTSVAVSGSWDQYQGRAHTMARTFRGLTDEERSSVEVLHLRLARALDGEDIAALSQRTGNVWPPGRTAVLNGVFVDRRFEEGDLVKIARASKYVPKRPAGAKPGNTQDVLGGPGGS